MAGLSLCLVLVAGLLAWLVIDDDRYVARTPDAAGARAQPGLAARTLAELERAVAERDPRDAAALAPLGDARARGLLGAVARNARALDVRDFSLRYVDQDGAVAPDGSWPAAVAATWAFAGFDPAPARLEITVRFRVEDGRAVVAGLGDGERRSPLWLTAPLRVLRGPGTLVLVARGTPGAGGYAARARAAVPVVRRVLPRWLPRLVVEVPGSAHGLDRVLGAAPGQYAAIAAVTTSVDGSLTRGAAAHVFVNPEVFAGLRPAGAQVVMSHETTHVATEAATSGMPLWLLEGFADYVALRDVDLPLSATAGRVIRQVRRDGVPRALPDASAFDPAAPRLQAAYEAAWLACRVLADRGGERALVRFYEAVDSGTDVDAALRATFGLGQRSFTGQWRRRLAAVAS